MKKTVVALQVLILLLSCNNNSREKHHTNDVNSFSKESRRAQADTTIVYDIAGASLEGSEAKVNYVDGKIRYANVTVFGETGQAFIQYDFGEGMIYVMEKVYRYKKDLNQVKSKQDMELETHLQYSIDYDGELLENPKKEPLNIFDELKKSAPFYLDN